MDNCEQLRFVDNPEHPRHAMKRLALVLLPALALAAHATDPATDADSFQDGERAFAAERHALAEGLAFGARVDFPVRVVLDDPATPPSAARVGWSSHSSSADGLVPDAEPGPDGVARLRGVSFDGFDLFSSEARFARLRASARNAWARDFAFCLVAPTGGVWRVAATNSLPWLAACEVAPGDDVVLRAIRRPVPTVRSEFEVPRGGLPAGGVGFDAEKGAFLPPLGDGETADFVVEAGSTVASPNQPGYSWFSVRPAGPLCAVQLARDRRDELRTPREAPADGWSHDPEKPLRFLSRGRGLFRPCNPFARFFRDYEWASGDESGEPLCGSVVLFRSRPRAAPDGETLFRYGAIVPPAALASSFETRYEVRFGSFPGFRSLEYVPRRCVARPVPAAPAPPAAPTGSGALLAAVAADGETAVFLGAEADGAFVPPTFPETVRFDPGAAASTPLARVRTLVVPHFVGNIPARAFEGLPALRCAVLPGWLRFVGARAFAGCPALEAAVFDDDPRSPLPADVFDGAAPGFAVFLGSRYHPRRVPGDAAALPRADGAPPLPATVVAAGGFDFRRWSFPGGVARYLGPRAEGGRLWRVREGAGAEILHRAGPAGPDASDPAELGGERVLAPAEIRRLDAMPPFLWERPAPGRASLAGFHSLEFQDGLLDDPLEIPAALPDGTPVVAIEPGAFSPFEPGEGRAGGPGGFAGRDAAWWASNAVDLVVPEGVRVIGARAFAGFAPLRSVRLPSTLEEIGPEAFADCIALRRIELPPSVHEIPAGAFKGCRRLEAAAIGAPGVRIGPLAFAACPSLVAVSTRGRPASVDPWAFRDSPSARIVSHAESSEDEPHAESAEGAEFDSHAENAESAEPKPHAEGEEN